MHAEAGRNCETNPNSKQHLNLFVAIRIYVISMCSYNVQVLER